MFNINSLNKKNDKMPSTQGYNHKNLVHEFFNSPNAYLNGNVITSLRKQIIFKMLGKTENKKIIDVGCGNGSVSIPFLKCNKVTFLDLSENMLSEVKKNVPKEVEKNCSIYQGDIESFECQGKFDIAIALGVLAHVESLSKTIEKISDLLESDGICVVQITDSNNKIEKIRYLVVKLKQMFVRPMNYAVNSLKKRDIVSEFYKNGLLQVEELSYLSAFPGFKLIPRNLRKELISYLNGKQKISLYGSEVIMKFSKDKNNF